jgi:hypothetical protein
VKREPDLERSVADLYDDRLPYHNFGHVLRVVDAGEKIMTQCRREGVPILEEVVYYALLLHDAGFQEDHEALGFDSKEAYSAHLAGELLQEHGVDDAAIRNVQSAILCTHVDATCRTNEDKVVRLADISGMAASYENFRADTVNLKLEAEILNGGSIAWDEWKVMASKRINQYLREDMDVLSDYYDEQGASVFHTRVRDNLDTLMSDTTLV